jgi:hypothetical protein
MAYAGQMQGRLRLFILIWLCWLTGGSGRTGQMPIPPHDISVALEPIKLFPQQPDIRRTGSLLFLQGYALHARADDFGGWSAVLAQPGGLRLISDAGAMLDLPYPKGSSVMGQLRELPKGCGLHWNKEEQDAEAATWDPRSRTWWVTLERLNQICRINAQGRVTHIAPRAMADWLSPLGAEALLRLTDGRFLIFAESNPGRPDAPSPVLLYDRDPLDAAAQLQHLSFRPPTGFRPVDAAQLPDGRILLLLRGFRFPLHWRTRLVVIQPHQLRAGAMLSGQEIARLEPPMITDDFEALAVTQEKRRTIIWLASDDNFWPFQQSYLLKFALED